MSSDPYDVLGVPREAQTEDLKAAYRRLVRENHPDVAFDKIEATARMARINQAWQLVGDPQKRLAFDARLRLESFERSQRGRPVASAPSQNGAQRASPEPPTTEKARLEAQRRARLERERLERERARRLRTAGRSPSKSPSKPNVGASATSSQPKTASPNGSKAANRQSPASREMRLRHKMTLAAQLFHREQKIDEAVTLCRSVLQIDSRSVPARELLGDIYLQQGRVEYALMMFDQALLIAPDNMMLRRKRDQLQNAQDRPKKSSAQAKKPHGSLLGRLRARLSRKS
jgi:curved DNA-binding protein CbpA